MSAANHYCMTLWARDGRSDECRLFRAIVYVKGDDEDDDKITIPAEHVDTCVQKLNGSDEGHSPYTCDKDRALDCWGVALEVFKRGSGFVWNDATKQIDAPDEVWDGLIKVYPDAKHVRHIAIPYFPMLREMFEKDRATGKGAETMKEETRGWTREEKKSSGRKSSRIEEIDQLVLEQQKHFECSDDFEENIQLPFIFRSSSTSQLFIPRSASTNLISKGNKKKVSKIDEFNENFDSLNDTISQVAKAIC